MRHKAIAAVLVWAIFALYFPVAGAAADVDPPVVVYQDSTRYALYNGHITATISKTSGEILSLRFEGRELLALTDQRAPGTWFAALSGDAVTDRIVIDPSANQGQRGEVSIRTAGSLVTEIRYALARGDHGLYACQILSHPANLPDAHVSSGGFQLRLDPKLFDYLTVSQSRAHAIPSPQDWIQARPIAGADARRMVSGNLAGKIVSGWDDAATQMETPVYGFSGAQAGVGLWIVNPSADYLSRGGNVIEPTGWLDSRDGVPTLMNRWGGEPMPQAGIYTHRGETWSHVLGPFLLYCNQGSFKDAQARAKIEKSQWPYAWELPDSAIPSPQRAAVSGQVVLNQSNVAGMAYATTSPLVAPAAAGWQDRYGAQTPAPGDVPTTQPQVIQQIHWPMIGLSSDADWQTNFFDDQIWIRGGEDGKFSMANVLPGTYTLHVYCDGQMGEATAGGVRVEPGQKLDLGKVVWRPRDYGQFVWQIGFPDRSAAEFRHGDDPTRWEQWALNPNEFPAGVNYLIGKGDPHKDWNFAQFPGMPWAIHFPVGFVPGRGRGFVHVALAGGSAAASLKVAINDNDISQTLSMPYPAIGRPSGSLLVDDIAHDQVRGFYRENLYEFTAPDIRLGDNVLLLRVVGPKPTDGLLYDCLRMEIKVDSLVLGGPGDPNNGNNIPELMPAGPGFDFGQEYVGDPSGDYRALGGPRR